MREELLQERKKAIYGLICDELYVPMKAKEIAAVLNVPKSDRRDLAEVLDALVAEGKVEVSSKGKYMKSEGKFLTGVFTAHPRGFGFVTVEGEDEDIFIPESQVNGAFHGDTVQVALTRAEGHGRRREGQITKILTRGVSRIVCTYEKSKTFGFAVPDNPRFGQDIFIPQERSKGAVSGHKVVVELTDFGGNGKKPEGKVVEILGHVNDPGTDILSIVRGYDLPTSIKNYKNTVATRIGVQYHACKFVTARLGMYVDESPVRSDFLNPETPSMTKVSYTAGVTINPCKNVSIDLAYGYITSADPERTGSCDYYNSLTYKAVYAQTYGQLIAGGMAPEQAKIQAHTTANDKAIQPFSGNYSLSAHTFAIGVNLKF